MLSRKYDPNANFIVPNILLNATEVMVPDRTKDYYRTLIPPSAGALIGIGVQKEAPFRDGSQEDAKWQ